eukprot:1430687-Rhodomonas_salina.2
MQRGYSTARDERRTGVEVNRTHLMAFRLGRGCEKRSVAVEGAWQRANQRRKRTRQRAMAGAKKRTTGDERRRKRRRRNERCPRDRAVHKHAASLSRLATVRPATRAQCPSTPLSLYVAKPCSMRLTSAARMQRADVGPSDTHSGCGARGSCSACERASTQALCRAVGIAVREPFTAGAARPCSGIRLVWLVCAAASTLSLRVGGNCAGAKSNAKRARARYRAGQARGGKHLIQRRSRGSRSSVALASGDLGLALLGLPLLLDGLDEAEAGERSVLLRLPPHA